MKLRLLRILGEIRPLMDGAKNVIRARTIPESGTNDREFRIELADLGERYQLHPTYISNQFKRIFGITPMQLQLQLRLRKAKHLLETENRPIGEVAKLTGYEEADDFSRFFKSKTGVSPLSYRNGGTSSPRL